MAFKLPFLANDKKEAFAEEANVAGDAVVLDTPEQSLGGDTVAKVTEAATRAAAPQAAAVTAPAVPAAPVAVPVAALAADSQRNLNATFLGDALEKGGDIRLPLIRTCRCSSRFVSFSACLAHRW
jgi:twitching motility protein PilJ